jgi:simple sugar transport system ATP-binding protein
VPNDRKREGLVGTMSVAENIGLKSYDRRPMARAGVMSWQCVRRTARELATQFDIRTASVDVPVGTLSGGNQQKVVLARELAIRTPRVIVAMNPVRGLDVAATNFVYEQLLARRAAGAAVLLISSELDELLALCDRVAVLYAGRLTMTNFPRTGRDEIGRLMAGLG